MEDLNNVPSTGTFGNSINQVNQNFGLVKGAIENVEGRTIRSKGLFPTQAALTAAYPSPKVGDYAYVGSGLPATIYDCLVEGTWHNTGQTGGSETINLGAYSTTAQMNTAIDNGLQGQVGYAECNTGGSTQRKDVVVNGFKLLASGGALHVKMINANTAANATMNISPTSTIVAANTKPLFYNGAQASPTNTWDANEIISVYYDGTNYQATNSQGGGGDAEKIKYNNSQSVLAADRVQEALDEVSDELYTQSNYPFELGSISTDNGQEVTKTDGTRIRTKGNVPKSTNKINFTVTRNCERANLLLYNNGDFAGSVSSVYVNLTAGIYVYEVNVEYAWDSYRIVCFTSGYTSQNLDGNYSVGYSSIKDNVLQLDEDVANINNVLPHGDAGSVSLELSESDYSVGLIRGTDGHILPDLNCRYLTEPIDVRNISSISYSIDNSYRITFAFYDENNVFLRTDGWYTDSGIYQLNGAAKIRIQLAYPSGMSDTFDYASANPQFSLYLNGLKQVASSDDVDNLYDAIYKGINYRFELGSIEGLTGKPVENTTGTRIRSKEYIPKGDGVMRLTMVMAAAHVNIICYKNGDYAGWIASALNDISAGDYAYKITVPFDYDTYKVVCNVTGATTVSANNTFVALPPAAYFGDVESINIEALTTEKIYEYYDSLVSLFPDYISKRVLGMDTSGQHEIREYVATLRDSYAYLYKERCYAWKNGSTTIFTESISPRVGDATYSDQLTTSTGYTVSASNCNNLTITVNGTTYSRQESEDIAADIQYRSTGTSSSITVSGKTYNRLPVYDKSSVCKKTIVNICNEHGPGINGDPREPSVVMYLLLKELCGETSENPQLDWLKHYAKLVIIPVSNPYAYDEDGDSTTLGNMMGRVNPNGVNINRNYPTTDWVTLANNEAGAYGGSEIETQYNINCIMRHSADIAIDEHCLGPNPNNYNQWHYEGLLNNSISSEMKMLMLSTYNLAYTPYTASLPGHGSTWIEQHDIDGCLIEMNQGYANTLHSDIVLMADRQIWLGVLEYYGVLDDIIGDSNPPYNVSMEKSILGDSATNYEYLYVDKGTQMTITQDGNASLDLYYCPNSQVWDRNNYQTLERGVTTNPYTYTFPQDAGCVRIFNNGTSLINVTVSFDRKVTAQEQITINRKTIDRIVERVGGVDDSFAQTLEFREPITGSLAKMWTSNTLTQASKEKEWLVIMCHGNTILIDEYEIPSAALDYFRANKINVAAIQYQDLNNTGIVGDGFNKYAWGNDSQFAHVICLYNYLQSHYNFHKSVILAGCSMGGLAMGTLAYKKPFPIAFCLGIGSVPSLMTFWNNCSESRKSIIRAAYNMPTDGSDDANAATYFQGHEWWNMGMFTVDNVNYKIGFPNVYLYYGNDAIFRDLMGGTAKYNELCQALKNGGVYSKIEQVGANNTVHDTPTIWTQSVVENVWHNELGVPSYAE